jgi:hypothetical protein
LNNFNIYKFYIMHPPTSLIGILIRPEDVHIRYVLHALPVTSQNFGSTSPLFSRCTSWQKSQEGVHPENNGKTLPKSCLGTGRTWKTYPIYTSSGCPKNVDNPEGLRLNICNSMHISPHNPSERETPRFRDSLGYLETKINPMHER